MACQLIAYRSISLSPFTSLPQNAFTNIFAVILPSEVDQKVDLSFGNIITTFLTRTLLFMGMRHFTSVCLIMHHFETL